MFRFQWYLLNQKGEITQFLYKKDSPFKGKGHLLSLSPGKSKSSLQEPLDKPFVLSGLPLFSNPLNHRETSKLETLYLT